VTDAADEANVSSWLAPVTDVAVRLASPGGDQYIPKRVIRVMVVEDHDATAYLIKKAFSERSERVRWDLSFAQDGAQALGRLFRRGAHESAARPDIVLLDWNLPKVSGREVLRTLKSSDEFRTLPVLIFSSSQDDRVVETAYGEHANGYICKPSDPESLYTAIESIETFWVHTARLPPNEK
jgi:CheY-like chemotaxis protein